MQHLSRLLIQLCIPLLLCSSCLAAKEAPAKPNVLFIFADDQCFRTINALGNSEIETPNLDRLVREGTTFTHAYNQGGWNGAICMASRTMLITGRYLWNANEKWKQTDQERQQGLLWPQLLNRAGYETYFTGKWHINTNAEKTFDVANHVRPGMPNQTEQGYNRPLSGQPDKWTPWDKSFEGFWKGGRHWSAIVADDAVSYLERAGERQAPFFMYLAFNAPHDPRQSPKEYVDKYPLKNISVPVNFQPEYPNCRAIGCSPTLRDEKLAPFPRTEHSVRVHRQEYYAIITHMDFQIGRILEALEKTGKRDNTWIVFTADHGLACGEHGLMGKQNMYDHSMRVPFVVVGPGVKQGAKISQPIYLQDTMATTLDLADVEKPEHVQFQSLLPLLNGKPTTRDNAIYGAYLMKQRMVTEDGYKLILYPEVPQVRLYHVADDPRELKDLAADPKQAARIESLCKTLLRLQKETGDPLDLSKSFPKLFPSDS